jgi:hypothetical protein
VIGPPKVKGLKYADVIMKTAIDADKDGVNYKEVTHAGSLEKTSDNF